jgi:replicative DNA helicase
MSYTFDAAFQEKVGSFFLRDDTFCHAVDGLIQPQYFENDTLQQLIWVQREYWDQYRACPSLQTYVQAFKDAQARKQITVADMDEAKRLLGALYAPGACTPADRQFVIDKIAEFAREKAIEGATLDMADALDQIDPAKKVSAIEKAATNMTAAFGVGSVDVERAHNFKDRIKERAAKRQALAAGTAIPTGITTGCPQLDQYLFPHHGWGRKELSILMGPPKSGKTAGLVTFAKAAAGAGKNVFYASCEVSKEIIEDRLDANISRVPVKELRKRAVEVEAAGDAWAQHAGVLEIQDFPTGTLKVSELRRLLKRYESDGIIFDMIVVDYIDIMAPERRESDKRHELSQITRDLRALAKDMNAAVLTATQTNREGTRKAAKNVTDGTDVAEDYDKVRLADALITINASAEEKQNGEVVLYFSEMRNTEGGLRLRFNQEIDCMRFITNFVGLDS